MRFADEADAIALANGTPFGLAAYMFSRDIGRIWRVMRRWNVAWSLLTTAHCRPKWRPLAGSSSRGWVAKGSRQGLAEYLDIKCAMLGALGT
jgi:succinate-semialdehyde dehydrogenase/glutarate-semialdehyde dehydrogenase